MSMSHCVGQLVRGLLTDDVLSDPEALARATADLARCVRADAAAEAACAQLRDAYTHQAHEVLLVAFELIYQLAAADPPVFAALVNAQSACYVPHLVHRMVHHIRAGHYAQRAGIEAVPRAPALPVPGSVASAGESPIAGLRALALYLCDQSMRLLHELCCHVRLARRHLKPLDGAFVRHLLAQIEDTRADEEHNTAVTLLVAALNEQYMAAALVAEPAQNFLVSAVADGAHKTFGENLVFILNRTSSDTADGIRTHLVVLKVLDQLFGAETTAQCLYTNDLRVLVDVILRELHDLPVENELLRQVYLRVFHALVTHTQLRSMPYKSAEAQRLFEAITASGKLRDISPVTKLLAERCLHTEWCGGAPPDSDAESAHDAPHDALALGWLHSAEAAAVYGATDAASVAWPPAPDEPDARDLVDSAGVDIAALDLGYLARRRAPPPPVIVSDASTPTTSTPPVSTPVSPASLSHDISGSAFHNVQFTSSMPDLARTPPPVCRSTKPRSSAEDARPSRAIDPEPEITQKRRHRILQVFSRGRSRSAVAPEEPPRSPSRRRAPPPPPRP